MNRIDPLTDEEIGDALEIMKPSIERLGFLPNSQRIMAHKPELLSGINAMFKAISLQTEQSISPELKYLVGNAASLAAGCMYCVAHTGGIASQAGASEEKIAAIWDFEKSPLFSEAERCALRFAQAAASVPNMVSDEDFVELKEHYTDYQIVEMLSVIAVYGFFNRWNDTLATALEDAPKEFANQTIGSVGWNPGKHEYGRP